MILEGLLPRSNTTTNRFPYDYDCKVRVIPRRRKIWRRSGPRSTHHNRMQTVKRSQASSISCTLQLLAPEQLYKTQISFKHPSAPTPTKSSSKVDTISEGRLPKIQARYSQDQNLRHVKKQWATASLAVIEYNADIDPHDLPHQAQKMKAQDSVRDSRLPGSPAADTVWAE